MLILYAEPAEQLEREAEEETEEQVELVSPVLSVECLC